jgi:PBSX family phage portal protein
MSAPSATEPSSVVADIATKKAENVNRRALNAIIIRPGGIQGLAAGDKRITKASGGKVVPLADELDSDGPGQSRTFADDPWGSLMAAGTVVEPPFDLLTLAMLPEMNSELGPCIEAMETNIEAFGHMLVPRVKPAPGKELDAKLAKEMEIERLKLENFFAYASLDDSWTRLRRKRRRDLESTGNAFWEVVRNAKLDLQQINHMPAYTCRLGKLTEAIACEVPILEIKETGEVVVTMVKAWRRFRKFAQYKPGSTMFQGMGASAAGGIRWFKEFGDPRQMDFETGDFGDIPPEKRATEVIHSKLYSARSPYGLPRFIGNLLAIFGDRAAEEINYVTFRNNNIPSMAVMVSNGQLTEGSINRIQEFVDSQIQGGDNYSRFLIIEAEANVAGDEGEDQGHMKLELKPLTEVQHKDALFQNYSKNNKASVRRSFRLPPIFVGQAEDYTRATAESSRRIADEQIFAPERGDFDDFINLRIFPAMGIRFHKFKTNSPNTTDNTELVGILSGSEKTGGMTPRIARKVLEDILGHELPDFPPNEDFDPDVPFSLSMAEAVKNMADTSEPGQQVTALKVLKGLENLLGSSPVRGPKDESAIDVLLETRKRLEIQWRTMRGEEPDEPEEE